MTKKLQSIAEDFTLTDDERRESSSSWRITKSSKSRTSKHWRRARPNFSPFESLWFVQRRKLRDASSRWLSPALLENLVRTYLAELVAGSRSAFWARRP